MGWPSTRTAVHLTRGPKLVCWYLEQVCVLLFRLNIFGTAGNLVFVVVTGTNLQALIDQAKRPSSSAEIVVVISNRPGVQGLKRASLAGIQTRVSMKESSPINDLILSISECIFLAFTGGGPQTIREPCRVWQHHQHCTGGVWSGAGVSCWIYADPHRDFCQEVDWYEGTFKSIYYWINIYCTIFNSFSSFRKAAEHPPISAALIQGCECSETGSPGRG